MVEGLNYFHLLERSAFDSFYSEIAHSAAQEGLDSNSEYIFPNGHVESIAALVFDSIFVLSIVI